MILKFKMLLFHLLLNIYFIVFIIRHSKMVLHDSFKASSFGEVTFSKRSGLNIQIKSLNCRFCTISMKFKIKVKKCFKITYLSYFYTIIQNAGQQAKVKICVLQSVNYYLFIIIINLNKKNNFQYLLCSFYFTNIFSNLFVLSNSDNQQHIIIIERKFQI